MTKAKGMTKSSYIDVAINNGDEDDDDDDDEEEADDDEADDEADDDGGGWWWMIYAMIATENSAMWRRVVRNTTDGHYD